MVGPEALKTWAELRRSALGEPGERYRLNVLAYLRARGTPVVLNTMPSLFCELRHAGGGGASSFDGDNRFKIRRGGDDNLWLAAADHLGGGGGQAGGAAQPTGTGIMPPPRSVGEGEYRGVVLAIQGIKKLGFIGAPGLDPLFFRFDGCVPPIVLHHVTLNIETTPHPVWRLALAGTIVRVLPRFFRRVFCSSPQYPFRAASSISRAPKRDPLGYTQSC